MNSSAISSRPATRTAALRALEEFLPRIPAYVYERNFDRVGHGEVSRLSPYLRRRLISEEEVTREVLRHWSFAEAEKFLQEIAWRTYWKGWLEQRPGVWSAYLAEVKHLQVTVEEAPWSDRYKQAVTGQTELEFFNDWVGELRSTGYLHNHTRMWFASVWIFTLKLPWQLGAHFMYRNLLDGDPASNTLSWRWVGGLQTPGKVYLARADNIAKYSEGRWTPRAQDLAREAIKIADCSISTEHESVLPLPTRIPKEHFALVVCAEDLSIEQQAESLYSAASVALLSPCASEQREAHVAAYLAEAMSDAEQRLVEWRGPHNVARVTTEEQLEEWIHSLGDAALIMVPPPTGPEGFWLSAIRKRRPGAGAFMREWDELLYPWATKGFFPFWEKARRIIEQRCVSSRDAKCN